MRKIIDESDEEKKYLNEWSDRELPAGERRKNSLGKYISEQQIERAEQGFRTE